MEELQKEGFISDIQVPGEDKTYDVKKGEVTITAKEDNDTKITKQVIEVKLQEGDRVFVDEDISALDRDKVYLDGKK